MPFSWPSVLQRLDQIVVFGRVKCFGIIGGNWHFFSVAFQHISIIVSRLLVYNLFLQQRPPVFFSIGCDSFSGQCCRGCHQSD